MRHDLTNSDKKAAALLRVASYLGRPQKFMAVADTRAEMRRTLELATKGSVVLTTHGEPEAGVVPFTTLEDMRRALMHLLVEEMESNLTANWLNLWSLRKLALSRLSVREFSLKFLFPPSQFANQTFANQTLDTNSALVLTSLSSTSKSQET